MLFSLIKGDFEYCKTNTHHVYPKVYAQTHNNCPWCRIDNLLQIQWNKRSNIADSIANSVNNIINNTSNNTINSISSSSYIFKYRNSTPLWVVCIVIGAVLSPIMWSGILLEAIEGVFGWSWTGIAAMIILAVTGLVSGLFIARLASEYYQNAYNAWPWLMLSLLAPVGAALICGALILIGILLKIALFILGLIFAIGFIGALCSGG